jgi:hypothetical protein
VHPDILDVAHARSVVGGAGADLDHVPEEEPVKAPDLDRVFPNDQVQGIRDRDTRATCCLCCGNLIAHAGFARADPAPAQRDGWRPSPRRDATSRIFPPSAPEDSFVPPGNPQPPFLEKWVLVPSIVTLGKLARRLLQW